jgi:hypothetical protein
VLAFRLAKHEPELVGDYYGPPEPVAAVDAEEPLEPARLVEEAERCWRSSSGATSDGSDARGSPPRRGRS